jgi:hypothetical protein
MERAAFGIRLPAARLRSLAVRRERNSDHAGMSAALAIAAKARIQQAVLHTTARHTQLISQRQRDRHSASLEASRIALIGSSVDGLIALKDRYGSWRRLRRVGRWSGRHGLGWRG